MKKTIPLDSIRRAPPREVALQRQGIPEGHKVSPQVESLLEKAVSLYEALAQPKGLIGEISLPEFQKVFQGEDQNTLPAPLPGIVQKAEGLALFAATIGEPVSSMIQELFQENDPATACMLDGIASERAEAAADLLAAAFRDLLLERGTADPSMRALAYSPGYCGWHITGQGKLFSFLKPEQIDITLSPTSLMSPIKSVSGVLVAGPPEIHDFRNDFEFCLDCADWDCRTRIASLFEPLPTED
jgi:hypothetical protein